MIHPQLLFFDTFSHDSGVLGGGQDLNLDLVQFPSPVYINEVRVIPLGAKVKANFPGGRMGATNPSKFDLELFVNNLRAPGASTFEKIQIKRNNPSDNDVTFKLKYCGVCHSDVHIASNELGK